MLFVLSQVAHCSDLGFFKLENGHQFIIKQVDSNPIAIVDSWVKTGSIDETVSNNGVAHFLEHMFFKGSENFPNGEFDKILESKGALTNAATSKDFTHFYIKLPSKDLNLALKLHFDMLLNPLLPRKELEKERKVVIEEISRMKDNPKSTLYKNMILNLYSEHPYKYEVIGTEDVINRITREEMFAFYNNNYLPNEILTVIVSNKPYEEVVDYIKQNYPKKSQVSQKDVKKEYPLDKRNEKQKIKFENLDVQKSYYMLGFRTTKPNVKDYYALDLLSVILGEGRSSLLYQNVKNKKQLADSIFSSHSSYKDECLFIISADFDSENFECLNSAIENEINSIKKSLVSPAMLEKAKKILEQNVYFARESISNISHEIGYGFILTSDINFYENYLKNINKVSVADIKRVANKYLNFDESSLSVVFPLQCKKQLSEALYPGEILASHKKESSEAAKLLKKIDTISKYQLANGATLLVNHNMNNDIVAIEILDVGSSFVQSKKGVDSFVASLMTRGTKKHDFVELSSLLEENGISIVPSSTPDLFSISLKTTKKQLPLALSVLDEIINESVFNNTEIEKVRREKLSSIKSLRDNPMNIAFDNFKNALWGKTPYNTSTIASEKSIVSISREDLLCHYNKLFDPRNIIVSINGNVSDSEMIKYFENIFKHNSQQVNLDDYKNIFAQPCKKQSVYFQKPSNTSWVVLGFRTDGVKNEKEWATLQVINSILGQGMSSRLFSNLRNAQSLAYQVGSTYWANYHAGVFALYIGTNPKTTQHSKNEMLKELEKLKTEFVSDKELNEAKEKLIGNYLLSLETNEDKASTFAWYEASNRGFEFNARYPDIINSVSSQDIIYVANKYFNDNYTISIVAP